MIQILSTTQSRDSPSRAARLRLLAAGQKPRVFTQVILNSSGALRASNSKCALLYIEWILTILQLPLKGFKKREYSPQVVLEIPRALPATKSNALSSLERIEQYANCIRKRMLSRRWVKMSMRVITIRSWGKCVLLVKSIGPGGTKFL